LIEGIRTGRMKRRMDSNGKEEKRGRNGDKKKP